MIKDSVPYALAFNKDILMQLDANLSLSWFFDPNFRTPFTQVLNAPQPSISSRIRFESSHGDSGTGIVGSLLSFISFYRHGAMCIG
jgi:hypothetical protein